jgi:hypothetical protein
MTTFSEQCIGAVNEAAVTQGFPPFEFKLVEGRKENYWRAAPFHEKPFIELYVYEDEAGYMLDGKEWIIFERPDFSTEQELIQQFVASVIDEVTKPA